MRTYTPALFSHPVIATIISPLAPKALFHERIGESPIEARKQVLLALTEHENSLLEYQRTHKKPDDLSASRYLSDAEKMKIWLDSLPADISNANFIKQFLVFYFYRRGPTETYKELVVRALQKILLSELKPEDAEYRSLSSDDFYTHKNERDERAIKLLIKIEKLEAAEGIADEAATTCVAPGVMMSIL